MRKKGSQPYENFIRFITPISSDCLYLDALTQRSVSSLFAYLRLGKSSYFYAQSSANAMCSRWLRMYISQRALNLTAGAGALDLNVS